MNRRNPKVRRKQIVDISLKIELLLLYTPHNGVVVVCVWVWGWVWVCVCVCVWGGGGLVGGWGSVPHTLSSYNSYSSFHIRHNYSLAWGGCFAHDDLWPWPWPISLRSFSYDFAIKLLLKYDSSCVRSTAHIFLVELFYIWHKFLLVWWGVSRATAFDLSIYLQGHSAMTLLYSMYSSGLIISRFGTNDH